jgi:predicted DNA-binding transcriptional regulator YafY
LLEGYFLPPITFARGEALALLLGAALLRSLRAKPFVTDLEVATDKLIAALPESEHATLRAIERRVGFEQLGADRFHPTYASEQAATWRPQERSPQEAGVARADDAREGAIVTTFTRGIIEAKTLVIQYRSPYRPAQQDMVVSPLGVFWDRGYWYLVGRPHIDSGDNAGATAARGNATDAPPRLWRADRVLDVHLAHERLEHVGERMAGSAASFDIATFLDRSWLRSAMARWADEAPVRIRLTRAQVERLQEDWYFRHARFEAAGDESVVMTFGETDEATVLEFMRWLGPHAELLEPAAWRGRLAAQLEDMRRTYVSV